MYRVEMSLLASLLLSLLHVRQETAMATVTANHIYNEKLKRAIKEHTFVFFFCFSHFFFIYIRTVLSWKTRFWRIGKLIRFESHILLSYIFKYLYVRTVYIGRIRHEDKIRTCFYCAYNIICKLTVDCEQRWIAKSLGRHVLRDARIIGRVLQSGLADQQVAFTGHDHVGVWLDRYVISQPVYAGWRDAIRR